MIYLYFDKNGVLKETIQSQGLRVGSVNVKGIAIYCELFDDTDIILNDIWYTQKNPDGRNTNEISIKDNYIEQSIPYNAKADYKYFKDFQTYKFYYVEFTTQYTSQKGLCLGTVRLTFDNEIDALGEITFNVEENVIKDDNGITQSQYDYLLLAYANRTLNATTGQDLDALIEQKVDANLGTQIEENMEAYKTEIEEDLQNYKTEIDNEINTFEGNVNGNITDFKNEINKEIANQNDVISGLGQLQPQGTATSTTILGYTYNRGIWVGTDTGHWYYWNGTQYADGGVYQSSEDISELKEEVVSNFKYTNSFETNDYIQFSTILNGYYRDGVFTKNETVNSIIIDIHNLNVDLLHIDNSSSLGSTVGYELMDENYIATYNTLQVGEDKYIPVNNSYYLYVEFNINYSKPKVYLKKSSKYNVDIYPYCEIKNGFYSRYENTSVFYDADDFITYIYDNDYNLRLFEINSYIPNDVTASIIYFNSNMNVIGCEKIVTEATYFNNYQFISNPNAKYIAFCSQLSFKNLSIKQLDNLNINLINSFAEYQNRYVYYNGNVLANDGFKSYTFECVSGERYLYKGFLQTDNDFKTYVVFQNENAEIIGYKDIIEHGYKEREFIVPTNAKYMIVNYIDNLGTATKELIKLNSTYYKTDKYNVLKDIHLTINGDSVSTTTAGRWSYTLQQTMPFKFVKNIAVGGSIYSQISSDERINSIPLKTNLIISGGVTNDFSTNTPLGSLSTLSDTTTFYGLVHNYISKLISRVPNAKIILYSNCFGYQPYIGLTNSLGYTMYDYAKAIKEVCAFNSIYYAPTFEECGINQFNYTTYMMDEIDSQINQHVWVHPNVDGSNKMLEIIIKVIEKIYNIQ